MHRISKAKFGAADIYSGGAGYHSFTGMQQHENGTGPVIDSSVFSSYTPASSIGNHSLIKLLCVLNLSVVIVVSSLPQNYRQLPGAASHDTKYKLLSW